MSFRFFFLSELSRIVILNIYYLLSLWTHEITAQSTNLDPFDKALESLSYTEKGIIYREWGVGTWTRKKREWRQMWKDGVSTRQNINNVDTY